MDHVDVAGLRIAYERSGTGPPLLLLQGFVADAMGTWRRQIEGLSDAFTVVAWDAPGAGGSSDPPESFGMADYADCLAGFVDAIGLERPHVAGLSFGGIVALELYRRHPGIPATLVLAGAYAGWKGSLAPDAVEERLRQCLLAADLPPSEFAATLIPSMFSESAPAPAVAAFAASVAEFHPAGFRVMARSSADADLRDVLPRVDVPTLLVYGDKDERASSAVADALHAAIPRSKLIVLPGVGHVSCVEAPEQFNAAVRRFLVEFPR